MLEEIRKIVKSDAGRDEKLEKICLLLKRRVPHYDWVGFYFAVERKKELVLGPFAGKPTDHTIIQYGRGICGQTALLKKTFIVQDVSKETNYLSCSPTVKSEIVVPVFKSKAFVAELDIDSHKISPFNQEDQKFLEKVSKIISVLF